MLFLDVVVVHCGDVRLVVLKECPLQTGFFGMERLNPAWSQAKTRSKKSC